MTKNNVRIAIRDSTDSYNIDFFDNVSGIHYHTADLQRFLAGSSSILTLKYRTKDIDKVTAGCKLAFRYKNKDFWLNIMEVKKNGFDKELTAFSLILEANNEDKGPFSADKGMTMAEYIKKFDAESSLTIGVNEVADKSIKLEWTGTDTMLARLFSVANSFGAELEFLTELNNDYSLKRHVLNIYRTGNFGKNATGLPIRVGRELKVINYSESIKNLRTVVLATGKDGLTIEGLSKKVYDDNGELLYETSGAFIRAVQSRDRFPSVGKNTTDNYALLNLGETEYETKEALYGYMLSELKKRCLPEMDFEVEGVIDGDVGDTKTLIDDVFHEPELYVQARISELTESIITGENTNVVLSNYERKYSQIADSLLKQVEALAEDAAPYIVRLSTDNGYNFKNSKGTSTITAKLEKYSKVVNAKWKWLINNSIVSETSSVTINASQVVGTLNVVAVASVGGNEVAREYITFTNSDDGVGIKSITRYYTTNNQAEGVTVDGQNWSTKPATVTADNKYLWSYDVITYTNDTSLVTKPAVIGARGDDGLDADTTGITEALDKTKQELTVLSANIYAVADDLSAAKQDLTSQAQQLTAQANAQSELTKRVSSVEETANGTKTTVSELSKTVDSNTKNITSVTARTKTVEDDLLNTKTTLSQVQTTADNTSKKTATLETGLNGVKADLTATTTTANTTKTNLANYQASNDKAVANLQNNLQTANGNISSLQTKVEAVPGQITSAVSAVEGKIPNVDNKNLLITSTATLNTMLVGSEVYPTPTATVNGVATIKEAIKVSPGEKYTFTKQVFKPGDNYWRVSYLNSNFEFISRFSDVSNNLTITIPKNVSYMWISFPINSNPKVEKGSNATGYTSSAEDIIASNTEIKQTTNSIKASVKTVETTAQTALSTANTAQAGVNTLDKTTVKSASLNLDNNGFVTQVGKVVDGKKFATMISQDPENVKVIADKMQVIADMIVDGAITADKIQAGSITADKIVASGLTADIVKGGVLTALNNAMSVNLNNGAIEFKTGNAALRRVMPQMPNQFVKFSTGFVSTNSSGVGVDCGVTVIGSNRDFTENTNNNTFTGIRIWNGFEGDTAYDSVDIIGDTVRISDSAAANNKSWMIRTAATPAIYLSSGTATERRNSFIDAGDIHLLIDESRYISLREVLNTFNGNFSKIGGSNYYPGGI